MKLKINKKIMGTISAGALLAAPIAATVSCGSKKPDVGVTVWKADDAFMSVVKKGFEEGSKITGTSFSWNDAEGDQTKHNDKLDALINSGVKALALNLVDPGGGATVIKKAKDADLPLILYNKEVSTQDMSTYDKVWYVGTRSRESGEMQVQDIARSIKDGILKDVNADGTLGYFVINGEAGHADAIARTEAVREDLPKELAKADYQEEASYITSANKNDFELFKTDGGTKTAADETDWAWAVNKNNKTVHIKNGATEVNLKGIYKDLDDPANARDMKNTTNWSSAEGQTIAETKIDSYKKTLDFIAANNDGTALGATTAAKSKQKVALETKDKTTAYVGGTDVKYLPIFGVDNTDAAIASMKAGWLTGTVLNDGINQGAITMIMASNSFKIGTTNAQLMTDIDASKYNFTNELDKPTKAIRVAYQPKYRGDLDKFK